MKVVIDANVVVSAVLKDRVPEEVILFVLAKPEFTWTASAEIIDEYVTVIQRSLPDKIKNPVGFVSKWISKTPVKHENSTFDRVSVSFLSKLV